MSNNYELWHWGIEGMRWGVRRDRKSVEIHDDYRKAHTKKSVKSMSDRELNERNKRLQSEKQYRELTRKTKRGKQIVNTLISAAGTLAAAESAYKTYKRFADSAIDGIGNTLMKEITEGFSKGL